MTARRPLIAGNWKMNCGNAAGNELAHAIAKGLADLACDVVIAPPATLLMPLVSELSSSDLGVAAQNMHHEAGGAYTGELSVEMVVATGAKWVLIGHSERRQYFNESNATVAAKTKAALSAGLKPIICVGETLEERDAGRTLDVVFEQLSAVEELIASQPGVAAIAYEPVWAIGTGKVASKEQAQEVHAAIRAHLRKCSAPLADTTRVLYGGSVKPGNAQELLGCSDIDGALVGGASLKADDFLAIAACAN